MTAVDKLDACALQPYLEANVDGFEGPMHIEKFPGGQSNPTFRIMARSGDYVLRRQPPGKLLKSAHAVDREYRVIRALESTAVPVPRVYCLCEDRDVLGSMFYVMSFCDGRIFWDASIPEVDHDERAAVYDEMIRVLSALHEVDADEVDLADFGKPGNYFHRQYDRWTRQYRASETGKIAPMEQLMAWLGENLPGDDGRVSIVHGDFRLDNLIFETGSPRARALIDWELSTLGHPYADVGYLCMQLRMPQGVGTMSGLGGRNIKALGIPDETEIVRRYCVRMGIDAIDNLGFYIAFSFFRLAAIIQGVARRAADGNASSRHAAQVGQFAEPIAALGLETIA